MRNRILLYYGKCRSKAEVEFVVDLLRVLNENLLTPALADGG